MPDNTIDWGQGSANNDIGWGKGPINNDLSWGMIGEDSYGHDETNLMGGGASFIDTFGQPALGLSLRDLLGTDPNVVRVRRDNDDAELDFKSSEVSDGTLASWVGLGNNGFVKRIYDQSGNDNDATSFDPVKQPKIYDSVTGIILENGKPAIAFAGEENLMEIGSGTLDFATSFHIFYTINMSATGLILQKNGGLDYLFLAGAYTRTQIDGVNSNSDTTEDRLGTQIIYESARDASNNMHPFVNQNELAPTPSSLTGTFTVEWIKTNQPANFQELIVYPEYKEGTRALIANNINNYYEIFPSTSASISGLPTVDGAGAVGSTLTANEATTTGLPVPTTTWQWQISSNGIDGWSDILGETSATYSVADGDTNKYLRVTQTSTNIIGSDSATSEVIKVSTSSSFVGVFGVMTMGLSLDDLLGNNPNVLRVRRSNDDSEADFKASEILDGTLTSWVGAGNDGAVRTWYNQGSGSDANQTTATLQPLIVDTGVLYTENGLPALKFNATTQKLDLASTITLTDEFYLLSIFNIAGTNAYGLLGGSNANDDAILIFNGLTRFKIDGSNNQTFGTNPSGVQYLFDWQRDGSDNLNVTNNNSAYGSTVSGASGVFSLNTIGTNIGVNSIDGALQSIIAFDSDKSAEAADIRANRNEYYSIY